MSAILTFAMAFFGVADRLGVTDRNLRRLAFWAPDRHLNNAVYFLIDSRIRADCELFPAEITAKASP